MALINKGILDSRTAYLRQVGNDWPTAQVVYTADILESTSNLYFTNARVFDAVTIGTIPGSLAVSGNLIANGLIIRNIVVSDAVLAGNITAANNVIADSVTSNTWNRLYSSNVIELNNLFYTNSRVISAVVPLLTTANIVETSANLYFTNARTRAAFTAGRGIILMSDGTIKSSIGTETFNTAISGGQDYQVTSSMAGITFTSGVASDRFILRSLNVTNV